MDKKLSDLLQDPSSHRYVCGTDVHPLSWSRRAKSPWGRFFRRSFLLFLWSMILFSIYLTVLFFQMPPLEKSFSVPRQASVVILDRHGQLITTLNDLYGLPLELSDLSPHVWQAVIATEDKRFFHHFGIDFIGLTRALFINVFSNQAEQGGSTITQQVAKNIFLNPERSLRRKLQELMVSFWLEMHFTKEQILAMYLNRVSLVSGKYGLSTAAKELFGKSASDLTISESAIMAAMLKAPSRYHPFRDPSASEKRARLILKNMSEQGYLGPDDYANALDNLHVSKPKKLQNSRYFTDYVLRQAITQLGEIKDDLIIQTTFDLALHQKTVQAFDSQLTPFSHDIEAAAVFLDSSGGIVSLIGGRNYGISQFNRAVDARRQPGSAFKPFVYLAAFEHGFSPSDIVLDAPVQIGKWSPENFNNHYYGSVSLEKAFALSLNSVPVRLAQTLGLNTVLKTAKKLGLVAPFRYDLSVVLGSAETSLIDLTSSYIPFSNGGIGVSPYAILEIKNEKGALLYSRIKEGTGRVIDPIPLHSMETLLQAVIQNGTGKQAAFNGLLGGKTGTSQNNRDAWFIGFTADITGGVWIGKDNNEPLPEIYGGTLPALIFKEVLSNYSF